MRQIRLTAQLQRRYAARSSLSAGPVLLGDIMGAARQTRLVVPADDQGVNRTTRASQLTIRVGPGRLRLSANSQPGTVEAIRRVLPCFFTNGDRPTRVAPTICAVGKGAKQDQHHPGQSVADVISTVSDPDVMGTVDRHRHARTVGARSRKRIRRRRRFEQGAGPWTYPRLSYRGVMRLGERT